MSHTISFSRANQASTEGSRSIIAQENSVKLREAQPVHIFVSDEAHCSGPDARCLKQDLKVLSLPQKAESQLISLV